MGCMHMLLLILVAHSTLIIFHVLFLHIYASLPAAANVCLHPLNNNVVVLYSWTIMVHFEDGMQQLHVSTPLSGVASMCEV